MTSHLDKDPLTDDLKERWPEDDALFFSQIRNSIDGKVLALINHCKFVKVLMKYLEFVCFFLKENISRIFDVCRVFYHYEKQDWSLANFFMDYKKTYEELNMLLPFSLDVKFKKLNRKRWH